MNRMLIIQMMAIVIILCSIVIVIALRSTNKKKNMLKPKKVGKSKDIFIIYYELLNRFKPTRLYIKRIRTRIEKIEASDNWTISRKTAKYSIISLLISSIIFIALFRFGMDLYYFLISLFMITIIHAQIISMFMIKLENNMLIQFTNFLADVRHNYHEHGMIDEAIYDSIESCKYEMAQHAVTLYQVLTSMSPEEEIDKYNDKAPNKYFKIFLSNCYTVQKFGDREFDGQSVFLSNINYLNQEIRYELLRREKLDYLFSSLSAIAVIPILSIKPLESWGKTYVPDMSIYFDGAYGFIVQIILFVTVLICYKLLIFLRRDYEYSQKDYKFYIKLLNYTYISKHIRYMIDRRYGRAQKYKELIRTSGTNHSIEVFYIKRIIMFCSAFILCLTIFFNIHGIRKHNILYSSDNLLKNDEQVEVDAELEIIDFDREIILKHRYTDATYQQIYDEVAGTSRYGSKKAIGIAAKRILSKIKTYNKEYFKWYEFLITLTLSALAYNFPYLYLTFKKKVIRMNMQDEVMQFHTIILMLITIERTSVEDILNWMEQFALIFRDSLIKCINNYDSGDVEALERLKLDEPYIPFVRICENLQAACERISIRAAFDQLRLETNFYQDKRKQDNEILINKKGTIAKIIAFIPLTLVIGLYLLVPFILVSINQLTSYSNQINGVF